MDYWREQTKCPRPYFEKKHLITQQIHFVKYIEPLSTGEATIEDSQKLWRNIQPILRDSMQSLYLREVGSSDVRARVCANVCVCLFVCYDGSLSLNVPVTSMELEMVNLSANEYFSNSQVSSAQWDVQSQATQKSVEEEMAAKATEMDVQTSSQSTVLSASDSGLGMGRSQPPKSTYAKSRVNVELPFFSKFLLAAAYIASYNPQSTDRRFFCKNAGRLRKSIKQMKK